jgi:hypothetical protein
VRQRVAGNNCWFSYEISNAAKRQACAQHAHRAHPNRDSYVTASECKQSRKLHLKPKALVKVLHYIFPSSAQLPHNCAVFPTFNELFHKQHNAYIVKAKQVDSVKK